MSGALVVKVGGAAIEQPGGNAVLWNALATLHARERAVGGGVIVVHGGGSLVDAHLSKLGMTTRRVQGLRVTPDEQIDEIVAVLAGKMNKTVVGVLRSCGAPAVGLSLGDGGTCRCVRHTPDGIDLGRVGVVRGGDAALLHTLLRAGYMPILCSIGFDDAGLALNVNADDAASALASIVGARRLALLTDVSGVLDGSKKLVRTLTNEQAETLIETGVVTGGMIPKVRAAVAAAESSGVPTLIASWSDASALAGLGADDAHGTLVQPSVTRARSTPAPV